MFSVLLTGSFWPRVCKNVRFGFLYRRQETVLTFRKLIKSVTFPGTVKTAQQALKALWMGQKRPVFTPLTLSSSQWCIWGENAPSFFVLKPANDAPASVGNGVTISFEAPPRAAIDAFHAAVLAAGGTCECLPGPRGWAPNAYAAYARDLDGNKRAAYCFSPD